MELKSLKAMLERARIEYEVLDVDEGADLFELGVRGSSWWFRLSDGALIDIGPHKPRENEPGATLADGATEEER